MSVRLSTSNNLSGFLRILVFGLLFCCLQLLACPSLSGAAAPSADAGQRSYDTETIDPATWRVVRMEVQASDGSLTRVELLRPVWWIDEQGMAEGSSVALNMPEVGAVGQAAVVVIEPCPPIGPSGEGRRPVVGRFVHENAEVLDLLIEGEEKPIGVTPVHPIWCESRQAFIPAGELRTGDEVQTLSGTAKVLSLTQRPGRHTVYNLEVQGDHVYRVGASGVLVHNKRPYTHKYTYADRVRTRGVQDPKGHNFPYSFDDEILATDPIVKENGYRIFQKRGVLNDTGGVYEIGVTEDGVIDHRFFRKDK